MKVLVISGFLGAGKTTFIRELVRRTGREIAILENEYAAAGMDGRILERDLPPDRSADIWEMTEGCICCGARGDFAASVLTIANTRNPEYLIVEPTGVGMLSNVLGNLQQIEYAQIRLLAPVAIVDGWGWGRCLTDYPEIFRDQISAAHTLVVSKLEQADPAQREAVRKALETLNPQARILTDPYQTQGRTWWEDLLDQGFRGEHYSGKQTAEKMPQSCTFRDVALDTPEELILLLEDLIRGKFGNLVRAKGVVQAGTQTLQFDVADGTYAILGREEDLPRQAVFFGEDIRREDLCLRLNQIGRKLPGNRPFSRGNGPECK